MVDRGRSLPVGEASRVPDKGPISCTGRRGAGWTHQRNWNCRQGAQVTLANRSRKWQRLGEGQPGGDHRGYRVSLSSPSSWWSWRPCWSPAEYWLSGRSHRDRRSAAVGVGRRCPPGAPGRPPQRAQLSPCVERQRTRRRLADQVEGSRRLPTAVYARVPTSSFVRQPPRRADSHRTDGRRGRG